MKKFLKSFMLVLVMTLGLVVFSACGGKTDPKDPPPPPPAQNLTDAQVKTVLGNIYDGLMEIVPDDMVAPKQDTVTSGFSKVGLDDADFVDLTDALLGEDFKMGMTQSLGLITAAREEDEIIGKAFSFDFYTLYYASATTEKIVMYYKVEMSGVVGAPDYVSYARLDIYLNSDATNMTKIVSTTHAGYYSAMEFNAQLQITHIMVAGADDVNLTDKTVDSMVEADILARKVFYAGAQSIFQSKETGDKAASIYTKIITIDPATIEETVSAALEGKTPVPIEQA